MASINKVILIGNLGRRPLYDDAVMKTLEAFSRAICGGEDERAASFHETCRRLNEALEAFRKTAKGTRGGSGVLHMHRVVRASAFFNASKVDGRNLP